VAKKQQQDKILAHFATSLIVSKTYSKSKSFWDRFLKTVLLAQDCGAWYRSKNKSYGS
jgi:hypothetical protein